MKDALRAAMEVVYKLDEQEEAVRRVLNRMDASVTSQGQDAKDRRRHLGALLAGVWSGSMWAMWARPLVAETWLQVDKGFVKNMQEQRRIKKEENEFKKLRSTRTGQRGQAGGNINTDTQMTFFGSIRAFFQLG